MIRAMTPAFEFLNLGNNVGDEGLAVVAMALAMPERLPNLKTLSLGRQISDEGAARLEEVLVAPQACRRLECVFLNWVGSPKTGQGLGNGNISEAKKQAMRNSWANSGRSSDG